MSRLVVALFYLAVMFIGAALMIIGKSMGSDVMLTIGQAVIAFVVVAALTGLFRWLRRLFS